MTKLEQLVWKEYWNKMRILQERKDALEQWELDQLADEIEMLFEQLNENS